VILTSGIYGTVLNVGPDTLSLEVAPGVVVKVATGAVARIADAKGLDAQDEEPVS
jgi:preprotein translocase subunit YajC